MSHATIVLTLPEEVVQKFRQKAAEGQRTVEEIMVETLMSYQPEADDYETLLAPLANYTDEQLWAVVNTTLTVSEKSRYENLVDTRRKGVVSEQEQQEINQFVNKIEMQMLFRSEALVLLKERGHTTYAYLNDDKTP